MHRVSVLGPLGVCGQRPRHSGSVGIDIRDVARMSSGYTRPGMVILSPMYGKGINISLEYNASLSEIERLPSPGVSVPIGTSLF